MSTEPMLAVSGLCVDLGGTSILRNVDLCVQEGSTAALIGRNGAGKTTTLRAIMGLVTARAGTVQLGTRALGELPAHQRARQGIGYAPEDRRMIGALTAQENILLSAQACRMSEADRRQELERIYTLLPELTKLQARKAGSLSGGQQKMVALGRALMVGRRLLLLDEPFQGLSPALARRYAEALAGLRGHDARLAILVAESNPSLLRSLVQVSYTIERGAVALA